MDDIPLSWLIAIGALIMLSAFFSSMEAALLNASRMRLRNFAEESKRGGKKAVYIVENLDNALSVLLLGNLSATVTIAAMTTSLFSEAGSVSSGLLLSIVISILALWVIGIMIPRTYGKQHADRFILFVAPLLHMLMKVFMPLTWLFGRWQQAVAKKLNNGEQPASNHTITEDELKAIVEISEEEGVLEKEEKELVYRSLDFDEIIVGEVLTPRPDMIAIEVGLPIEKIKQVFFKERLSRIPVYDKDIDNIIGILSEREFFSELLQYQTADVRSLLRKPKFVVKSMKISALMLELQKSNVHMAIVIDEFGGTAGLITLEDTLEQLVGEIWDEHDEVINMITKIDETTYEVSPQLSLDDFEKAFSIPAIESDFYNLGGWIFGNIDRIPQKGDSFQYEHVTITVAEVEKKRVKKLTVSVQEPIVSQEE